MKLVRFSECGRVDAGAWYGVPLPRRHCQVGCLLTEYILPLVMHSPSLAVRASLSSVELFTVGLGKEQGGHA